MEDEFGEELASLDHGVGIFDSSMEARIADDPIKLNLSRRIHGLPLKNMAGLLGQKFGLLSIIKNKSSLESSRYSFWLYVVGEGADKDFTGIEDAWRSYLEHKREWLSNPENSIEARQKRDRDAVEIVKWVLAESSTKRSQPRSAEQVLTGLERTIQEKELSRRTVEWAERLLSHPVIGPWGEFRDWNIDRLAADRAKHFVSLALERMPPSD